MRTAIPLPLEQSCAVVMAGVGESVQLVRCVTHDDERLARDFDGEIIAGVCDFIGTSGEYPGSQEYPVDLASIEFLRGETPARQRLRVLQRQRYLAVVRGIKDVVDPSDHHRAPDCLLKRFRFRRPSRNRGWA